jgi:hypothetical protein
MNIIVTTVFGIYDFSTVWKILAEILVEEAKNFLVNNNNIISLEMVVFCAIDDETRDYLKREFASMKDFVRLLIN